MFTKLWEWLVRTVLLQALDALGKYIPHVLEEWKREKQRELLQKEAKEKHEAVLNNPKATREELAKALEERLNAGKNQ